MNRVHANRSSFVVVAVVLLLSGTCSGWAAQIHVGSSETSIIHAWKHT
jgi:hypothetical protein